MRIRSLLHSFIEAGVLTIIGIATIGLADAQVRSSQSYQLESDSINFGGGYSSSSSYTQESTFGEVATGDSTSTTYQLRAGYQQLGEAFISLAGAAPVTLTPPLGGLSGGTSNGSTSVVVVTDGPAGYELTIRAENSPAMQSLGSVIDDYASVNPLLPDYAFITDADDAHFGFSVEGEDTIESFLDDGESCGVGALNSQLTCWQGLSVGDQVIARGGANQPAGATTTVHFRVGIGGLAPVLAGEYIATTTITAVAL